MKTYQDPSIVRVENCPSPALTQAYPQIPECEQQGGDCGNELFYFCNDGWRLNIELSNATCEFNPLSECSFTVNNQFTLGPCQVLDCEDATTNASCGTSAYYEILCQDNIIVPCGQAEELDIDCEDGGCSDYTVVLPG